MEIQEQYLETKNNEVIDKEILNIPVQSTYNLEVIGGRYVAQELQQDVNQEKVTSEKEDEVEDQRNETGEIVLNEEKQLLQQKNKAKLAKLIFLAENKELIVKNETVKAAEYILNQRMNALCELMNQSKEELTNLENEDKILETKMNLLPKDIDTLQKRVENGGKILNKLKGIFEKLQNDLKEYTQDTEDIKTKHKDHKKELSVFINDVSSTFSQTKDLIKGDIQEIEKCRGEKRKYKEECDDLQRQINEQRQRLQILKDRDVELSKRADKVDIMAKENKEKRDILKRKQEDLMKLKGKKKETEDRLKHEIELLKNKRKEKEESVSNQHKLMEELNGKAEQMTQQRESAKLILASKQTLFDDSVKQKNDAEEKLKSAKENLELSKKKNEDELMPLKETNDALEEKIKIKEGNLVSLKRELELVKNDYTKEMKKHNDLILQKCERDKKIAFDEMLLSRLNGLKTKLEEKTKKKEVIEEKMKKLSDESFLQELQKDKAYLEASLKHLDDKHNEVKAQEDEVDKQVKENEEIYNNLKKSVLEKREEIETLKKGLKTSDQKSILKTETGPRNDTFKSPKKVQFNPLMEVKSLSSADTIESSQEERSAPKKLLDEIFQSMQKKQIKLPKRRFMEFDE